MNLHDFINFHKNLISINLFNESYEDQDLLSACKIAISNKTRGISSLEQYADNIWKWCEKSKIPTKCILNNKVRNIRYAKLQILF